MGLAFLHVISLFTLLGLNLLQCLVILLLSIVWSLVGLEHLQYKYMEPTTVYTSELRLLLLRGCSLLNVFSETDGLDLSCRSVVTYSMVGINGLVAEHNTMFSS